MVIHLVAKEQLQLAILNAPEMPIRYAVDLTQTQFIKPNVENTKNNYLKQNTSE